MSLPKNKSFKNDEYSNIKFYQPIGLYILDCQSPLGAIPSLKNGKLDPWDHIESTMGLTTLGHYDAAKLGFNWLFNNQNSDGSWFSEFKNDQVIQANKQTHFSCYVTVGLLHFFKITKDIDFIRSNWKKASKAINFSINLQNTNGTIPWCINEDNLPDEDYLITASSSILKSLECAMALFNILEDKDKAKLERWEFAYNKLRQAIRNPDGLFDLKISRKRFSMDCYYPVISGAFSTFESKDFIKKTVNKFYIEGIGIKCVEEEPWVTVAETNEFVMAAIKADQLELAKKIFCESLNISDSCNIPYMGWQYEENIFWPDEKPSWTAAALILAADAIYTFTNGSDVFIKNQTRIFLSNKQ